MDQLITLLLTPIEYIDTKVHSGKFVPGLIIVLGLGVLIYMILSPLVIPHIKKRIKW